MPNYNQKIIAHRGLCNVFVENTIQAITSALYCSDLVELDIQLTKDNQIIVFHDRGLKRVTNIEQCEEFAHKFKQDNIEEIGI